MLYFLPATLFNLTSKPFGHHPTSFVNVNGQQLFSPGKFVNTNSILGSLLFNESQFIRVFLLSSFCKPDIQSESYCAMLFLSNLLCAVLVQLWLCTRRDGVSGLFHSSEKQKQFNS